AARALLDLVADRHAVRRVAETQDSEQDDLLELAEIGVPTHIAYIVELTCDSRQPSVTPPRHAVRQLRRSVPTRSQARRAPRADTADPQSARRARPDRSRGRRRSAAGLRAVIRGDL